MRANMELKVPFLAVAAVLLTGCSDAATGPDPTAPFESVSTGTVHTCALTTGGDAYCWGWGEHGQNGNGKTNDVDVPAAVIGGVTFASISAGGGHTCGTTSSGQAYCWGLNETGQLGNDTLGNSLEPTQVAGGVSFTTVEAGGTSTCGLTSDGTAYCWGYNELGQLGDGTTDDRSTPVAVLGGLQFQSISPGSFHTCAVTATGEAYCWGKNEDGQLGVNSTTNASEPALVSGGLTFASVDAGHDHTCGVTTDGDAYCWGSNKFGRLGSSSSTSQLLSPTQVDDGTDYLQMSAGASYTCGIRSPADAWCWGLNQSGQLGAASAQQCYDTNPEDPEAPPRVLACSLTPIRAVASLDLTVISASSQHTCGLASDQVLYCWGSGVRGQLGGGSSGSDVYSVEPVRVARQP